MNKMIERTSKSNIEKKYMKGWGGGSCYNYSFCVTAVGYGSDHKGNLYTDIPLFISVHVWKRGQSCVTS